MSDTKEYIKGIAIVLGIVIVAFALKGFLLGGSDTPTGNSVLAADSGEVQYVTLKFENYQYVIEPSELKTWCSSSNDCRFRFSLWLYEKRSYKRLWY